MKNEINGRSSGRRASAGFGLVETMVALVIGLLATFIIMQIFATSEGQKRTITGGADAQTDAAVALYLIERDLRQAGYGLSANTEDFGFAPPAAGFVLSTGILGECTTVQAYNANRATTADFTYTNSTFAPVVINPPTISAGDANTDVILVNYSGTGGMVGKGIPFTGKAGTDDPNYAVADAGAIVGSRAGFVQGDMVLAVPPSGTGLDCTVGEITGFDVASCPAGVAGAGQINHDNIAYLSAHTVPACGAAVNAAWNKPGSGVIYTNAGNGSRLYNLGPVGAFVSRAYAVRKGNLTMCDLTVNDCTAAVADPPDRTVWSPIAAGVVGLKAQYGKDTNFNGTIDAWNATQPVGPARVQVIALRLAVVVRSSQFEKEDVTTVAPVWYKDAATTSNADIDISASSTDWKRYRYRAAQSIVPLRNMIWGEQQ
jgi:type IV pilus assembly protein PilW